MRAAAATTGTGRVEAFSDGVIAIALTLLVLDLTQVPRQGEFTEELLRDWPTYVAYLAAFFTIASNWVSHHAAFTRIERIDSPVLVMNLGLLLGLALVPWPTALLSKAIGERGGAALGDGRASVVAYVAVSLIVATSWTLLSSRLARRADLLREPGDAAWMRRNARQSAVAGAASILIGAVGMLVPVVALVAFLLVPIGFFATVLRDRDAV